ncbi:MAG: 16S rRNA (guanine(966)-N(2))-methyltransferase RsmD [Pseudomonadota bacterium]
MRIISGSAKGRRLATLKGRDIRPTSDKIRQAVFNILDLDWESAAVLDLFAGTGALGIESLSRGARAAVFADDDRRAVEIIKKNLELCDFSQKGRVFQKNVLHGLSFLKRLGSQFDLVFIDPPYGFGMARESLISISGAGLLAPSGTIVVEYDIKEELTVPPGLRAVGETRQYGRTMISFLEQEETGGQR